MDFECNYLFFTVLSFWNISKKAFNLHFLSKCIMVYILYVNWVPNLVWNGNILLKNGKLYDYWDSSKIEKKRPAKVYDYITRYHIAVGICSGLMANKI